MTEKTESFLALYPDGHHETITLGEVLHKGGAAGKIYRDASHPGSVAKIFHDLDKSDTNRKKLQSMLLNSPNIPVINNKGTDYIQIAWPTALLENDKGFCVGYLMPLIDTNRAISLDYLIQKAVRRKLGLPENYLYRLFAAFNITSVVAALHACGHYIVDLKPSNISIYKDTMLVALFDCDGFSIKGENGARYPAEFVSEEYIYPEAMKQTCREMGEEQDKFALAVIIFKLLNEGIHPFSGTPRKNDQMLSIQERIAAYHYAYGMWPDNYQYPHPYSMHDYFDKETMNLFERAFGKGLNRPTALEWQTHLDYLLHNYKKCKKDRNHIYFTPKGCGLCMINEKFKLQIDNYKKQQQEPPTIRGLDIKTLTKENLQKQKKEAKHRNKIIMRGCYAFIAIYVLFFTFLYKLALAFKQPLLSAGIFAQLFLLYGGIYCLNKMFKFYNTLITGSKIQDFVGCLKVYGYLCLIIAFLVINGLSADWFRLAQ